MEYGVAALFSEGTKGMECTVRTDVDRTLDDWLEMIHTSSNAAGLNLQCDAICQSHQFTAGYKAEYVECREQSIHVALPTNSASLLAS